MKFVVNQLVFICNVFRKLEVNRKVDSYGIEQAVIKWRQALNQEKIYYERLMELSKDDMR